MRGYHADFADQGLVVIGVHSPEFGYEKDVANVRAALRELSVDYPVAIDNDFAIWNSYRNRYWPARYVVDKRGVIRFSHIGEGAYAQTREVITQLLAE